MKNAFGIAPQAKPSAAAMMLDAAHGLNDAAMLDCIRVMLDRIDAERLDRFANELGRAAHMKARQSLTKRAVKGGGSGESCAVAREGDT